VKNIIREEYNEVVDHETGEVKQSSKNYTFQIKQEPPFVKIYLEHIVFLNSLPKGTSLVLAELIKTMNYNGEMVLNSYIKTRIAESLNMTSTGAISNAITQFVKTNILKRVGLGTYTANPFYFARGKWEDISRLRADFLEINITYNKDGSFNVNDDNFKLNKEEENN
jgi:hypothetical protein